MSAVPPLEILIYGVILLAVGLGVLFLFHKYPSMASSKNDPIANYIQWWSLLLIGLTMGSVLIIFAILKMLFG